MKIIKENFSGIIVPLITPFYNNQIDFESLEKICDFYVKNKADGFVVCGTTGEAATLSKEEKNQVISFVIDRYSNVLPILVGISASDTASGANEAKLIEGLGADGLLVLSPPYVKPSQDGLYEHFNLISSSVSIPTLIYNIPHRTGVNIEFETIRKLSKLKNIIGIKECSGDLNQLMNIINHTDLRVFTGEDHLLFITSALGGHGAISAAAHVCLSEMKEVHSKINSGDLLGAREIFKNIIEIIRLCFAEPNPSAIKAILAEKKLIRTSEVRLPLIKALKSIWARYEELKT